MSLQSHAEHFSVLVVDDEEELRALLCYELKRAGFKPIPCFGLKHAVQNFLEHQPELILSDMRMPDGTGLQLFKKLQELQLELKSKESNKESQKFKEDFSFIVMTGFCKESPELLKAEGIFEVLFKPFEPGMVLKTLRSATEVLKL